MSDNPYLDLLQQDTEGELRRSMMGAIDKQPDDEAALRQLAKDYQLPLEAVRLDRKTVERKAKLDAVDYVTLAKELPATATLFRDPNTAAVVHDDLDNLSSLERTLQLGKNVGQSVVGGVAGFGEGVAGVLQAGADALAGVTGPLADALGTPDVLGRPLARDMRALRQNQAALRTRFTPQAEGNIESGVYAGVQSLTQNLLTAPFAVLTGNPALMLNTLAGVSGGQSYGKARDKGLSPEQSALYGAADAAIEYGTEMLPVTRLLGDLKAGSSFVKTLVTQLATEIPGEQVATALQDLNEYAVLNPEANFSDYLAARPDAALQTLVATAVGSGGMVSLVKGADALVQRQLQQAQRAEALAGQVESLNGLAAASKVLKRDPDLIKSLADTALIDADAQHVFIDANTLAQSGLADQVASLIPDVGRQLPDALETGGEIKIATSDYLSRLAGTEYAQSLVDHVRVEGEEFSRAQAREYQANHASELQAEAERMLVDQQRELAAQASMQAVKDIVQGQLESAGRFTGKVNAHNASMIASFYAAMGERMGMSAESLWERLPLTVESTLGRGLLLNQALDATPVLGEDGIPETAPGSNGEPLLLQRRKRDDYTLDLFDLPDPRGGADRADVSAGAPLSRDDTPRGQYATRTALVEENSRQLGTARVNTPEEAAQALAYLAKGTVERFDALITDAEGTPLAVVGAFKGTSDGAAVYPLTVTGEAFRVQGAANIWFAHNHPSGLSELSPADRTMNERLTEAFRGSQITPRGMFAIGGAEGEGRRWVYTSAEPGADDIQGATTAPSQTARVPVVERVFQEEGKLSTAATDPASAKRIANELSNGESGLVLMDNQHQPVAFVPVNAAESEVLRGEGRMDGLYRALSMANANAAIIVNQGDLTQNAVLNLAGFFNSNQVRVLDVLDKNGDQFDSRADAGLTFAHKSFNQGSEGNRGAFNPETRTITLLDNADLSTFLHESGHLFLELQLDLASNLAKEDHLVGLTEMQRQVLKDTETLLSWFGVSDMQSWFALDFEEKRGFHEQFAKGFEQYLLEGQAPSLELARVFASFRAWLQQVYQSLKQYFDDVNLTDEVRQVFDRMLATDEQIALAQQGRSLMPLFSDPEKSGMDAQQFAEYQAAWRAATNEAKDQLALKGVRDMQWLQNARHRTLKALQQQHDALRREVRAEVRMDVYRQPVYQAWQFLTRKLSAEDKLPPMPKAKSDPNRVDARQDSLFAAIAKLGGLDRQELMARWDWDHVGRAPTPVFGKPVVRKSGGLSIEAMAEKLLDEGYLTADSHGKFDTREFEERFDAELRGQAQYSQQFDSTLLLDDAPAGSQVANLLGLTAARLDATAFAGMLDLPDSAIQKVTELKMTARTGLHPDIVAELFGFSSGDEMVRELAQATPPKELIEQLTDQRMLQEHGELSTPEAIQREAERALSNEARAKFVATEANMLSKMTGSVRLLTAAAKEMANNMIARVKVRDLSPSLYSRAEALAAKAALKAEKAGDMPTAAAEKRNQLINLQANKAAHQAQDDVEKIIKYLKKFDGNVKRVDFEYLDEIRGILQKYDFHSSTKKEEIKTAKLKTWVLKQLSEGRLPPLTPELLNSRDMMTYLSTLEQRDDDGNLIFKDDEKAVELLAELIDASEKQSYRDMTIEELRGLYDTVRVIEKMGRDKDKMFSIESAKRLSEIRLDMAQSVIENGGEGNKKTRTANDAMGKKFQHLEAYGEAHIKASHLAWVMDGGKENGPVWRHLVMPANIKSAWEVEFKAGEVEFFNGVLRPILDDRSYMDIYGKGTRIDGLYGASLNFNERLAVLLNVGNESNMQRLMDGGIVVDGITRQLAPSHVMKILETFTAKELWAAQKIWDRFETYWPMIEEMERRLTGVAPEKIPIRPITIKSRDGETVTLRGGYYPVVFDQRTSGLAKEDAQASDLKEQQQASRSAATTRRSFAKSRVAEVYGRPLLLNLQGLYSGVNDVIHYLAWQEWILDTNRLLKPNTPFHEAVLQYYGPSAMDELMKWKNDIVLGQRRLDHQVEKMVGFVRRNLSMASMATNFMTAATQPLGFTNTIGRIGAEWTARGVIKMASHPVKATQEALAYSRFMRNRTRTQFRDLHELRNMVESPSRFKEFMGKYGFWMMTHMQMLVDIPTWWGAYEKQLSVDPGNHDLAVQVADQAVKDSQGGGEEVDQSGMERGNAVVKLFTGFYSYMATTGSLSYSFYKVNANKPKSERQSARTAAHMLVLLVLPAQLTWMLQAALQPGGDDDDDSLLKKIGKAQFSFMAGLFVGGRELSGLLDSYTGYHGPSGLRMFDDAYKLSSQVQQFFGDGEFDAAFRKAFINMLGDLYGIPSAQINKTWTGAEALADGETDNPTALLFGFKKQ